ncbi:cation efflux family-domain-containing protein [Podospora didyma]|uniref:Cation efflux family-domain-containing protein n=1 Tax=Podospora didyma TaxID=330526 RepID=A0AAE0N945_9PEZI|nr:cation efflux family-domain-containing protein [Podospora didyma]
MCLASLCIRIDRSRSPDCVGPCPSSRFAFPLRSRLDQYPTRPYSTYLPTLNFHPPRQLSGALSSLMTSICCTSSRRGHWRPLVERLRLSATRSSSSSAAAASLVLGSYLRPRRARSSFHHQLVPFTISPQQKRRTHHPQPVHPNHGSLIPSDDHKHTPSPSRPNCSLTNSSSYLYLAPQRPTTLRPSNAKILAAMATQTRAHSGHSHSHAHHHHHHDNVYLTSQNKKDAGVRITRIGLYSNLGMAIAKGAGGYYFNSQSMVADAWHSLTDLASDVLTLATVSWSLRPPTKQFPLGFGKVESLGSLGVSSMLLFGGLFMCMNSCTSLYAHLLLDPDAAAAMLEHGHHHGHSHSHGHDGPSLHAAWLAAGTVAVKEWLYHATMKVARERKSSVLASNAVHHRVDSLTGIVTLLAILGANFLNNAAWLDPIGGLLISLLVIRAGWGNTLSALYELADRSIDAEVTRSIKRQISSALSAEAVPEVTVRDVTGVKSGQNYLVDIELAVPKAWTVEEVRGVEDAVRAQVGAKVRGVRRVRVRFVPLDAGALAAEKSFDDEFVSVDISPRTSPEPESEDDDHDAAHNHGNGNGDNKKSQ